jgi:hypothetical protein
MPDGVNDELTGATGATGAAGAAVFNNVGFGLADAL